MHTGKNPLFHIHIFTSHCRQVVAAMTASDTQQTFTQEAQVCVHLFVFVTIASISFSTQALKLVKLSY